MIILVYFTFFFPPLCCYSLTKFFKTLLEHSLQEFPLSTCKPEGNSCHVWHMAIISVVCEKNPQDPSQKSKSDNGPLMSLWSLQNIDTNFSTTGNHSKLVIRMRFAKRDTKLRKICRVRFQGQIHETNTLQRKDDKEETYFKMAYFFFCLLELVREYFLVAKSRILYLLVRNIYYVSERLLSCGFLCVWGRKCGME